MNTGAATVNRNIGYPRFRTHGRFRFVSPRFRFGPGLCFLFTLNVVKTDIDSDWKISYNIALS